ncbi:MAG: TIGR00730 family Rossman fold protein, partial [Planctomycetia bacterium]
MTVFGSARFDSNHKYYQLGVKLGEELSMKGFTVMTGGGPGIMETANRGAKNVGGFSIGCNITLPKEQKP